ncbi:MAG: FtsQ-type POTRA domain-containing protein [Armatimonadota bacterium]|nr:FtsQ-type POTRA domain-containing protein [bacterium]
MRRATTRRCVRRRTRPVSRSTRNRKKPNYRLLFSFFFMSVLLSMSITYALQTPDLNVSKVGIQGVELSDGEMVNKYSQCMIGKNIFLVRKYPVSSAILGLNEIESVRIGRKFPDKMWVQVTERKAGAVLTDGRTCCMIQDDGLMFHKTCGPVRGIPLIEISNLTGLQPGKVAGSDRVGCALEVVKLARNENIRVDKISIDPDGDICLNMSSGFYVRLGQPDDIARKMSLLRSALAYRPSIAREAIYIDLSCPSAPVWRPKAVAQNAS